MQSKVPSRYVNNDLVIILTRDSIQLKTWITLEQQQIMTTTTATSQSEGETTAVYTDLIGFLKSDRADLRLAATEAVKQTTDR